MNAARATQIISISEPGFDSIFSGNTTDICPVGALTTVDFRFGGASRGNCWRLASICAQCPVGCNTTFNTRREATAGGDIVIKRVMPRQNEEVNEIWMCDKGRFAYHYTQKESGRLAQPMVRGNEDLAWDTAAGEAARLRSEDPGRTAYSWPPDASPMKICST